MEILFVNACVRKESRTRELAELVLSKLDGNITEVNLEKENLQPLTRETLDYRSKLQSDNDLTDEMIKYAWQFAKADVIVVAAPYWDLSFPASLKTYIEHVNVVGVTFAYKDDEPYGLCKGRKLIYVTTAGGEIYSDELGYGYIKMLCEKFYGIKETVYVKAEKLDLWGADVEGIMNKCKEKIRKLEL